METWHFAFIALVTVAVVLQTVVLTATFLRLRRIDNEVAEMRQRFNDRVDPLLNRLEDILKTVQTNSHRIFGDLAAIAETARDQTEKVDHITDELTDRTRLQIIRLDDLLTRALHSVETAGEQVERGLRGPVGEAVAVVHGVRAALDFLARRRTAEPRQSPRPRSQEEELFV